MGPLPQNWPTAPMLKLESFEIYEGSVYNLIPVALVAWFSALPSGGFLPGAGSKARHYLQMGAGPEGNWGAVATLVCRRSRQVG